VEFSGSVFGLGTFGGKLKTNFAEANVVGIGIVERQLLDQAGEI